MNNFKSYILIGFDFRLLDSCPKTVDASVWLQAKNDYLHLIDQGYIENAVQLLDVSAQTVEKNIHNGMMGVAIAVSKHDLKIMESMFGGVFIEEKISPSYLLQRGWLFEGFDVADANGYFSVFGINHKDFERINKEKLFSVEEDAISIVHLANAGCPSHAPFLVFAVFSYKKQSCHM